MKQTLNNNASQTIVVDLDGTLTNSNMLYESLFLFIRLYPLRIFETLFWLIRGKANLKMRLADEVMPNVTHLPYNRPLIEWLRQRQAAGARLVLATASDVRIASNVAKYLNIFDEVIGTENGVNLSSKYKRDELISRYGEHGYEYVGNSKADLAVWKTASVIHLSNPAPGILAAAKRRGKIGQIFKIHTSYVRNVIKAIRLHQWMKNLLIFVPLIASHRFFEAALTVKGILAFIAYGLCASSVYLLNDLLDMQDDRNHQFKRCRPIATGDLSIIHAVVMVPIFLGSAFVLSALYLPITFVCVLAVYYLLTVTYSLWLKRIVMLDVVCLAILFSLRVIAGAAAMALPLTFWIISFCIFIFLSLAFVKRYTELYQARESGEMAKASGRGYYPADFELLASLGGASGYISVLVLALYINESSTNDFYPSPEWMWVACPLLLYWISHFWLVAHRGKMHDDPIVFALCDKVSLVIGVLFATVFVLAAQ